MVSFTLQPLDFQEIIRNTEPGKLLDIVIGLCNGWPEPRCSILGARGEFS